MQVTASLVDDATGTLSVQVFYEGGKSFYARVLTENPDSQIGETLVLSASDIEVFAQALLHMLKLPKQEDAGAGK